MKKNLYTSLLLGAGLAFAANCSHAKPSAHQVSAKKSASAIVSKPGKKNEPIRSHDKPHKSGSKTVVLNSKPSKKSSVTLSKHSSRSEHHDSKHSHKHKHIEIARTTRHLASPDIRLPSSAELDLATTSESLELTPTRVTTKIPHIPSTNRLIQLDLEATENNQRIHSLLTTGTNRDSEINPHDTAPSALGDYATAHGIITSTLEAAGEEAGLSEDLLNQLTTIFAWDIDFATNLHRGDQFTVVYEQDVLDNQQIIAAEFVTQGHTLTAVRYTDDDGNSNYYTPEGKAMRKAFLSTPVDYARISSHFDANRRHPILNRIRAHKGVDYAARTGTPVKASGDGKIAFLGRRGGYGQVIIIKHGERYETLYAHLSEFKRDLLEGDEVNQGDVIGYVGQTGLATGPHLHYEFRVDGEHTNPELQAPRHLMTLNGRLLGHFKVQAQPVLAQLYAAKAQTLFAKNQHSSN